MLYLVKVGTGLPFSAEFYIVAIISYFVLIAYGSINFYESGNMLLLPGDNVLLPIRLVSFPRLYSLISFLSF